MFFFIVIKFIVSREPELNKYFTSQVTFVKKINFCASAARGTVT